MITALIIDDNEVLTAAIAATLPTFGISK